MKRAGTTLFVLTPLGAQALDAFRLQITAAPVACRLEMLKGLCGRDA